jgi:hypothetical protein
MRPDFKVRAIVKIRVRASNPDSSLLHKEISHLTVCTSYAHTSLLSYNKAHPPLFSLKPRGPHHAKMAFEA